MKLTFSSKVFQAAFAYENESVSATGTFTANSDKVVGIGGEITGLGTFSAGESGGDMAYTLNPADVTNSKALADAAKAIVDAINGALAVEAPVISGTSPFDVSTEVSIDGPEGAEIYYTVDGSTPNENSTLYEEPITLSDTATVKAIAIKYGQSSAVASETFTKNVVAVPEISGTSPFDSSTAVTITGPDGADIYYTTDGTTPDSNSTAYSAPFTLDATTTVKAIAILNGVSSAVASETFTKN